MVKVGYAGKWKFFIPLRGVGFSDHFKQQNDLRNPSPVKTWKPAPVKHLCGIVIDEIW